MKIDRTRLFDKRVVQRNIRAGRVTKDEYRAWLGDQSDARDKIMAREEGGDDDGYEIVPKAAPVSIAPAPAPMVAAAPVAVAPVAVAPAEAPASVVEAPAAAVAHEPPPSDQAG